MPIIIPANSAVAGGFNVENGVMLNFMDATPGQTTPDILKLGTGTDGNMKIWTMSIWVKRTTLDAQSDGNQKFWNWGANNNGEGGMHFDTDDFLIFQNDGQQGSNNKIQGVFRDTNAWYHIVWRCNVTESDNANRWRCYINGVQRSFVSQPTISDANGYINRRSVMENWIGANGRSVQSGNTLAPWGGYVAEAVFIDGQSLAPTSFGEFDEDSNIWKPIKSVADLTFGDEGYYLNFQNAAELGTDVSGNSNTFSESNITADNQSLDTCTNNFMTLSPLYGIPNRQFSQGNLQFSYANNYQRGTFGSITPELGKWYFEFKRISGGSVQLGVANTVVGSDGRYGTDTAGDSSFRILNSNYAVAFVTSGSTGRLVQNGNDIRTDLARVGDGEIGMYAFDLATGKIWTGKSGTWDNSGNPATGANPSGTWSTNFTANTPTWFWFANENNAIVQVNFGSPMYSISSGNADGNNQGNFEYAVPAGFLSLCTKNLSEVLS